VGAGLATWTGLVSRPIPITFLSSGVCGSSVRRFQSASRQVPGHGRRVGNRCGREVGRLVKQPVPYCSRLVPSVVLHKGNDEKGDVRRAGIRAIPLKALHSVYHPRSHSLRCSMHFYIRPTLHGGQKRPRLALVIQTRSGQECRTALQ